MPRKDRVIRTAARLAVVVPTVLAVLLTGIARPVWAQQAAAAPLTRADYETCQTRDEAAFKQAIEGVTLKALESGLRGFDYRAAVGDEWRRHGVDQIMIAHIDKAIEQIRTETGFTAQISSLFSRESATQLATLAAERVYRSDDIKDVIEKIAGGVARDIGKRLELATVDAAEPAMRCLEAFLGPRYGTTIAGVVAMEASRDAGLEAAKGAADVSTVKVLIEGKEALAGAIILIVRRQLAKLSARVGQRLVGAVLSRVVSVIAGGVGLVLIAKDVWEMRHGALPIIASEMKSIATRDKVQEELGRAIGEQIGEHLREISTTSAERIIEIWHEFRRAHAKVLEIAERDEAFRRFVDNTSPRNLARLDEIVALVLASETEAGLHRRVADGTLHQAVERLPASALVIARETRSLETALGWSALAGTQLGAVVETEIYRRNGPEQFSKAGLARILGLGDRMAMTRLAALKASVREPLFELGDPDLRKLARALSEADLASLSGYLTGLARSAGHRLLTAVAAQPARMQVLAPGSVREAILASRDQGAAVGMMLRTGIFDFGDFADDVGLVRDGLVDWRLLWAHYPGALTTLGILAVLFLAFARLMLFGRRPRIVIEAPRARD